MSLDERHKQRLFSLRQLIALSDIVKVYCSNARSILEYASAVFASLSPYDGMAAKRIQTHTLAIIFIFPAMILEKHYSKLT